MSFDTALKKAVDIIAQSAKANASWSHGNDRVSPISSAIASTPVSKSGNTYKASVVVDLKVAPQAAAFEFGSGLHNPRQPEKYLIRPVEKLALAFFWSPAFPLVPGRKFIGISKKTGKHLFRYVSHPGVAPRPFLMPALYDNLDNIRNIIQHDFKVEIVRRITEELNVK